MSDISLSTQQQLTQALAQLNRIQHSSPIAKQAAQVIIQHLAGNQIALTQPRQQQSITLPKPEKLPAGLVGVPLDAALSTAASTSSGTKENGSTPAKLQFFDTKTGGQQTTSLGRLNSTQLGQLLAAIAPKASPELGSKSQLVVANVIAVTGNQVTLSVTLGNRQDNVTVNTSSLAKSLKVGESVLVQITPKGDGWQGAILKQSAPSSTKGEPLTIQPLKSEKALQGQTQDGQKAPLNSDKQSNEGTTNQVIAKLVNLDKKAALALMQGQPANKSDMQPQIIGVPKQTLIEAIRKEPGLVPGGISQQLRALPEATQKVVLSLLQNSGELSAQTPKAVISLPLTKEQAIQVANLLSGGTNSSNTTVIQGEAKTNQSFVYPKGSPPDLSLQSKAVGSEQAITAGRQVSGQQAIPEQIGQTNTTLQQQQATSKIVDLVRRLLPQIGSPAAALQQIHVALQDASLISQPETKSLLQKIETSLTQGVPQGKEGDAQQIRQLLSQPALNLTAAALTQPPVSQQGLIGGLIAMLQLTLTSRLARSQPQAADRLSQLVTGIMGTNSKPSNAQTQRSAGELSQLEQKHQLLKQLGRIFAQHQASKLASAEQALQGQEGFYYVLPASSGNRQSDVEILIKREQEKAQGEKQQSATQTTWHLTMKLDIGEMGQMLTKARLHDMTLELDFYTSNDKVKEQVLNYLPLFKRRLHELGIEVAKTQCQLGKIPTQLQTRPYQIFETKA